MAPRAFRGAMSCDGTCSPRSALNSPAFKLTAEEAAQQYARMSAAQQVANCEVPGKILAFARTVSVLDSADGTDAKTNSDPDAGPIDYLLLQPFGRYDVKLHGLLIDAASEADRAAIGVGEIQIEGRDVRPRVKGTFADQVTPASTLDCDRYYKCGIDPLNSKCIRQFSEQSPGEVLLVNTSLATIDDVNITVLIEYVPPVMAV